MRRFVSLLVAAAALAGCTAGANMQSTMTTIQKAATTTTSLSGSVVAPKALLGPGASVISVGGGNVIAVGGGNVIAVGGGNVIATGGGNFTGLADRTLLATETATEAATASASLTATSGATASDGLAPVSGTLVAVYDLNHKVLKKVTSNTQGQFELKGLPKKQVLAMRTIFQTGGKEYYLSTLFRLDKDKEKMPLDPMNTVIEAAFFKHMAGKSEKARGVSMTLLQTLWTHANNLDITFDPTELEAARTLDELVKVYEDKVVARFPEGGEARTTYQSFIDSLK